MGTTKNKHQHPKTDYQVSVYVKGTVHQTFALMQALRIFLFTVGCDPLEGETREAAEKELDNFAHLITPPAADDPMDFYSLESVVNAHTGKKRLDIAARLNAIGAWLTGRSEVAPPPAVCKALKKVLDIMGETYMSTVPFGQCIVFKTPGRPSKELRKELCQFFISPLKPGKGEPKDEPLIEVESLKLADQKFLAGNIIVQLPVRTEAMSILEQLALGKGTATAQVVSLLARRLESPAKPHATPAPVTAHIIPFPSSRPSYMN